MKRKLMFFATALIFVLGIGIMIYPLASSVINNLESRSHIEEYSKKAKQMSSEETLNMLEKAEKYNESLTNNVVITDPFDENAYEKIGSGYNDSLNVDGNGLIGYVDIPKINVYLPIYHGTTDKILSKGAGHLQNTSLPIGGESTHSVISAHTAYPGETFFDYLTDMKQGDVFYIHVLDRVLKYKVNNIEVILPEETDSLRIVNGKDYVTLLTCTPYGVNTHRLLVRGERVDYDDSEYISSGASAASFSDGGIFIFGLKIPYYAAAIVIAAFIAFVIAVVIIRIKKIKKKALTMHSNKNHNSAEKSEVD